MANKLRPIEFSADKKYRPSLSKITRLEKGNIPLETLPDIQMSDKIFDKAQNQVLMRLKRIKILDWKARFKALGIGDETNIYVITLVSDGESDKTERLMLSPFTHVKKGQSLSIGKWGVSMYTRSGVVPRYLDIRILVARSAQNLRDMGKAIKKVKNNSDVTDAVTTLAALATGPVGIVLSQADKVMGIVGAVLQLQKDDQLLYYVATVHRDFDNLGIGTTCDKTKLVDFCYQIQVGS